MSQLIIEKNFNCFETASVTVNITEATQFTFVGGQGSTATVYFEGVSVALLTSTNPVFKAETAGEYKITITGTCGYGAVFTSEILEGTVSFNQLIDFFNENFGKPSEFCVSYTENSGADVFYDTVYQIRNNLGDLLYQYTIDDSGTAVPYMTPLSVDPGSEDWAPGKCNIIRDLVCQQINESVLWRLSRQGNNPGPMESVNTRTRDISSFPITPFIPTGVTLAATLDNQYLYTFGMPITPSTEPRLWRYKISSGYWFDTGIDLSGDFTSVVGFYIDSNNTSYVVSSSEQKIGTVDLATGVVSSLGATQRVYSDITVDENGIIYGTENVTNDIYIINPNGTDVLLISMPHAVGGLSYLGYRLIGVSGKGPTDFGSSQYWVIDIDKKEILNTITGSPYASGNDLASTTVGIDQIVVDAEKLILSDGSYRTIGYFNIDGTPYTINQNIPFTQCCCNDSTNSSIFVPTQHQTTCLEGVNDSGEISNNIYSVYIENKGAGNATINGVTLGIGESYKDVASDNGILSSILYDATSTLLTICVNRRI